VALARHAIPVPQRGQGLHVHVHEADLVVLELSMRAPGAIRGREAVEPFGLEDAVDRVPVQVRQDMREDEGEVVEREASGAAQRADDGALLFARVWTRSAPESDEGGERDG
jgi:hypothetical protein